MYTYSRPTHGHVDNTAELVFYLKHISQKCVFIKKYLPYHNKDLFKHLVLNFNQHLPQLF